MNPCTVNEAKETALIIATKCNRPHNIHVIVGEDEEAIYYKDAKGMYPIHYAAKLGFIQCLETLRKADKKLIDLPGGCNKMTPLMFAVCAGH